MVVAASHLGPDCEGYFLDRHLDVNWPFAFERIENAATR